MEDIYMQGVLILLDENKNLIAEKRIKEIEIKEEYIIQKSLELFGDRDPCILHRTYCINKIRMEILEELNNASKDNGKYILSIDDLSVSVLQRINLPPEAKFIMIQ